MTYKLFLGDRTYSSWSLRGWLLFEKFDIDRVTTFVDFAGDSVGDQLAEIAPARTVPTLVTPEGAVVSDSLAMAEEMANRHPDVGIWPADVKARATARTLAAEMHSGFTALRSDCPMNLRVAYADFAPYEEVEADLRRLEVIWSHARATCESDGPWLCGDYSAADAFYAPVAARIAGYGLQVNAEAQAYVNAHLCDPAFRRWRAMGFAAGAELPWYRRDHTRAPWPGPAPLHAQAVEDGTPENPACPYSGKPVTHLMELDGRIFGMCNAFCRDKTVADPEAWPQFLKIYHS